MYLAKEGHSEVSAQVPLPCGHNIHHLPEGIVKFAVHLHHVFEVPVPLVEGLQEL